MTGYLAGDRLDVLPVPGAPDGAAVTFRAVATWADEIRLSKLLQEGLEGLGEVERALRYRTLRALVMIESWTLAGPDGQPLPLTEATLTHGLSKRVADWLDREAARRYDGREEAQEGPFDSPSRPPSTDTP